MFFDNSNPQSEPVAIAKLNSHDLKLVKLPSANLPKLPHIAPSHYLLPNNISPRQKSMRQEGFHSIMDQSALYQNDTTTSRGPKVLAKNLPDVFISSGSTKSGRAAGLRTRRRGADGDSSTFMISRDQICATEPDGEIKQDDSPPSLKYGKYNIRPKDRSPKRLYGKQGGHLNFLVAPVDTERLSTDGSPANETLNSINEMQLVRLKSIEDVVRSDRDLGFKPEVLPNISDRTSPGFSLGMNSATFNNIISKADINSNLIRVEQKMNYVQNPSHPKQAKQQLGDVSFEMLRKPGINMKKNQLAEVKEGSSYSFHDMMKPAFHRDAVLMKAHTRDNISMNHSVSPRNPDTVNAPANFTEAVSAGARPINKLDISTRQQNKKLFIFKKIGGKSNKVEIPVISNVAIRGKERIFKQAIAPSIHLNELITLKKVKSPSDSGKFKRMLHAPTLKMYDLYVESIGELNPKESVYIKDKLNEWKNNFCNSRYLQKVSACFWNSPEGCVSILLECSRSGFLNEVLDQYGSLPENCVQTLGKDVLQGINEIHATSQGSHGSISLNEVIIGSQGHFKLGPGISQMFTNFSRMTKSLMVYDDGIASIPQQRSSPKLATIFKESFAQDIFDFGYLLLQSALGDLSLYDPSNMLSLDNLKKLLESENIKKHPSSHMCCLLHSEDFIRKLLKAPVKHINTNLMKHKSAPETSPMGRIKGYAKKLPDGVDANVYTRLLEILTTGNRFSESCVDFLCNCLRIDESKRASNQTLLNHRFLNGTHVSNGPLVSMRELLKLGKNKEILKNVEGNLADDHLEKFRESLGIAFLNREVQEKFLAMMNKDSARQYEDRRVIELASELDVSPKKMWNHIQRCMSNLEDDT